MRMTELLTAPLLYPSCTPVTRRFGRLPAFVRSAKRARALIDHDDQVKRRRLQEQEYDRQVEEARQQWREHFPEDVFGIRLVPDETPATRCSDRQQRRLMCQASHRPLVHASVVLVPHRDAKPHFQAMLDFGWLPSGHRLLGTLDIDMQLLTGRLHEVASIQIKPLDVYEALYFDANRMDLEFEARFHDERCGLVVRLVSSANLVFSLQADEPLSDCDESDDEPSLVHDLTDDN